MTPKPTTNQKPQVQIRITIGGQTFEETISGPLVAMPTKGGT